MSLESAFAVSAVNPRFIGKPLVFPDVVFDPAFGPAPEAPGEVEDEKIYVDAYLTGYGGYSSGAGFFGGSSPLPWQVDNDELVIGLDPADPGDNSDITDLDAQIRRRCAFRLLMVGHNVRSDHQYLIVFGFHKRSGPAVAQFYVGAEWVRSEPIDDKYENVALLLEAPGPGSLVVYARLASSVQNSALGLTGIEGFVI